MARILITGGAGYVGSHCAKALAEAGHECVVFDSLVNGHREFVRWGPLIVGDIRNQTTLDAVFAAHTFDAVLHCAALAYVGESVTSPGEYYDVNVGGTRALVEAMTRAGVTSIVFSSSCAVYGEPSLDLIGENTPTAPINPYGRTKLICEGMLDDFAAAYGLRSIRLRYFNAAGADPSGAIGEDHDPETHLIPIVLDAAMGRRAAVCVFGTDYPTPDGSAVRDYVHVADLAAAHVAATVMLANGGGTQVLNLGTGRGVSVTKVIETVRRITGCPVAAEKLPRRVGDPARLVADASNARRVLGWAPQRSNIDTVVSDAWRWHVARFAASPVIGSQTEAGSFVPV